MMKKNKLHAFKREENNGLRSVVCVIDNYWMRRKGRQNTELAGYH